MAAISNAVSLIIGVVVLGLITREVAASGNANSTSIASPMHRTLEGSAQGKKCMVLKWHGVCDPVSDCKSRIEVTLSKGSTSGTNTIPLFSPFTYGAANTSQAVCFYDSSESASCCSEIISGLSAGNQYNFGDNEKVKFKISVYHKDFDFNATNYISVESSFLLPWKDACRRKPCGDEGTCHNHMTADFYNCTCKTPQWTGANCTVEVPKLDFEHYARKCLAGAAASETLDDKTIKDCFDKCKEMGAEKCKSFEFKQKAGSKGKCTLKNANAIKNALIKCDSDYFQLKSLKPNSQGNSVTAIFASFYIVLAILSRFFLIE